MEDFLEQLKLRHEELLEISEIVKERLAHAPKGSVKVKSCHGKHHQYYYAKDDHQPSNEYAGNKEMPLIQKIVQKEYDQKIRQYIQKCLSPLEKLIMLYESETVLSIFEKLPKARQCLISPVMKPDHEYLKEWLESFDGIPNGFHIQEDIITNKGEPVRSKSEKIIADKLFELNIPYLYEVPLNLPGTGTVYPDFTILNIRRRKTFYYEHFGLMDEPEYVLKTCRKILAYSKNNLWFGDGLLYSFESKDLPINTVVLETMIRKYLL